ncbi:MULTISPECIES: hypothetical protein [unclassified Actinoplanes]|uniref:hypothetical protein n=1 Tax=unclassified Actinoplanes TaxID=2626549 RepID=UPI0003178314|nr:MULTISPECIES: hypothetical protein [unclassified Actinoplanes]
MTVRFGLPDLTGAASTGSPVRASLTGAGTLLSNGPVRRLLLAQWLPAASMMGTDGLLVAFASGRGFPGAAASVLLAASPAGMFAGELVMGRLVRPAHRPRLVAPLMLLTGAPLLALGAVAFPASVALLVLAGFGFAYGVGLQQPFLQAVPAESRGQSFALLSTGAMTLQGLGPLVFGAAAQLTTPGLAIAAAGLATIACLPLVRPWSGRRGND